MTVVLLCGEGSHDIGHKEWDEKTGEHVYTEGWLQPLVTKVAGPAVKFKSKQLRELFLSRRPPSLKPIPKGHSDKAAIAKLIASLEGCSLVVFMTDADTSDEKERSKKVKEIEDGFALIKNDAVGVPCVPKSASESWLLSDVDAWIACGLKDKAKLPKYCPEDLWGSRDDPAGNHPKHAFARAAEEANLPDNRITRVDVCSKSSLDVMKQRCPTSLGEFAKKLGDAL